MNGLDLGLVGNCGVAALIDRDGRIEHSEDAVRGGERLLHGVVDPAETADVREREEERDDRDEQILAAHPSGLHQGAREDDHAGA